MNLTIDYKPEGNNGTAAVFALADGKTIHSDRLKVCDSAKRIRFIDAIVSAFPDAGLYRDLLTARLVEISDELTNRPKIASAPETEIDLSQIARPEMFFTGNVAGTMVPVTSLSAGKPVGRWVQYLRWFDGRDDQRQAREINASVDVRDGVRLWFHPLPGPPSPTEYAAWSAGSRKTWLAGDIVVDPAALFRKLCEQINRFIEFSVETEAADSSTLALWIMLTYIYSSWPAVPYLNVGGALGSGKSRVFEILARLAFRPLATSNTTAPVVYRSLHDRGGTLLLDEAESLRENTPEASELRKILLSGYKKGSPATRCEGGRNGEFTTRQFDVYGPKAIAGIASLPETLASRSIRMTMFRAGPGSAKPRRRIDEAPEVWADLRDYLHIVVLEYGNIWPRLCSRTDVCPAMPGRDFELWQPILALAAWLQEQGEEGLLELMQEHALRTIEVSKDESTPDNDELLLRLLADAVSANMAWNLTPGELLRQAKEREAAAFEKWSSRGVSNAMKRYGIMADRSHGKRLYRNVTVEHLAKIQETYSFDLGIPPLVAAPAAPAAPF